MAKRDRVVDGMSVDDEVCSWCDDMGAETSPRCCGTGNEPPSPGDMALEFLEKLLRVGQWYSSAIELDVYDEHETDGEKLKKEAQQILEKTRR